MKNYENGKFKNRLASEKSPYLLQHSGNPVDWYPWCEDAFKKAQNEDKPVFLSIGYSTCHWCHVMEHESFENIKIAKLINDAFVPVKVDREERPDIDKFYMSVCQMLNGTGGWPLTIIMTPDKKPFFAGTYFPSKTVYGRIGMMELIPRIRQLWKNRKEDLIQSGNSILISFKNAVIDTNKGKLDKCIFDEAYNQLCVGFDSSKGGFGQSPKFPIAHTMSFLLRYWLRTGNDTALFMVTKTLSEMRKGGIYDHIGFGFHRYSTDRNWIVPHFEKMLYDQAMIAIVYLETFQATGNGLYKETAEEIFDYVFREMTHSEGGFYSAQDADSEGIEGKYYLWGMNEVCSLIGKEKSDIAVKTFNLKEIGNYVDEISMYPTGKNIIYMQNPLTDLASELNMKEDNFKVMLNDIRNTLLTARNKRISPHKDDKILADWNGLMISALAKAAKITGNDMYLKAARKTVDFIFKYLIHNNTHLFHVYRDGYAGIYGNLDDYSFLVWGLLEIYEASFDTIYLQRAISLTDRMIDKFYDNKNGGFYFTGNNPDFSPVRQKDIYDGPVPSGNSIATLDLIILGKITGDNKYIEFAEKTGSAFINEIKKFPSAYTQFLCALDFAIGPSREIIIASNERNITTGEILSVIYRKFDPNKVVILKTKINSEILTRICGFTKNMNSIDNKTTLFVCKNYSCEKPVSDIKKIINLLR